MSRLSYGLPLWGLGARTSVLKRVQTVQNQAACWILEKHRLTKTKDLLKEIGWLSMY